MLLSGFAFFGLHAIGALTHEIAMQQLAARRNISVRGRFSCFLNEWRPTPMHCGNSRSLPETIRRLWCVFISPLTLQRMPFENRWPILEDLMNHPEDSLDPNLPMMYWYAAEPCISARSKSGGEAAGIL
jgi:hypothetical protein